MKRKYLYYSKYKINGLECHEFDEIIIPINHEWVREVYIYKEKYEVFIEFELKNKRNNKEGSELEKDCEVLIQKLLYRLYVKDVYMSKHSYRHITSSYPPSNVDFPCGLVRYTSEPGRFMNEDILEYKGTYYTLSETRMPFKSDKTVDEDYFILTLFALALEAKSRSITLSGKDIVLGVGLPPADFGQQAQGFKRYFMEHAKHGISFKFNGKAVNCYLKDTFVSPQNFAAVMCYKASLFKQYRTVNCIDIGEETVDLLVIRKGQPDLSVRVSDRSGMAILRSEISNVIQQNFGIHLESSDVEQVLMQEATILDEEVIREIKKMAEDWLQRIINKLHAYVPDFRTNPAVFLGGGSLLLKPQIEKSPEFKYIEFIEDVRANAVGYEKMTAMRLQKR